MSDEKKPSADGALIGAAVGATFGTTTALALAASGPVGWFIGACLVANVAGAAIKGAVIGSALLDD